MKLLWEMLFLFSVILTLSISSEIYGLGIPAICFLIFAFQKRRLGKIFAYRKSVAYLAIVPFAFWWFLSPSQNGVFSQWLLIIPSWYFLFLALWQWKSVGRGGYSVFVYWNALFVLLLSLREWNAVTLGFLALAFLFLLFATAPALKRPKNWLQLLLSILLAGFFVSSFQRLYEWRQKRYMSGAWEENYREERSMMGFSNVAALGSFERNFSSKRNAQIVLRLFTDRAPTYLRAVAYGDYSAGIWNLPKSEMWLFPERYIGDYAVFGSADSAKATWVQSALSTFDFAFAPPGAAVALKEADSVKRIAGNSFYLSEENKSDWYYVESNFLDTAETEKFLNTPHRLDSLLNEICAAMHLDSSDQAKMATQKIRQYFLENFSYSLQMPRRKSGEEPLILFWKNRKGFCEYYATLSTLLLRKLKIPARYVVGFANPEVAESGGYFVFRRNRSHAWVEVFDGEWKIFDPTPPIPFESHSAGFFEKWSEKFKAKCVYGMHLLRDGNWRKSLDSWSNAVEALLKSTWFYSGIFVFALMITLYVVVKRHLRQKQKKSQNLKIQELQKLLRKTEKVLAHFGFVRAPAETVSQFILRLEKAKTQRILSPKKMAHLESALQNLQKYENERWCR